MCRVPGSGTDRLRGLTRRVAVVVLGGTQNVRRVVHQPSHGRTTCRATTITSQAIGTAAKKPRAALHADLRRTVPDPVGCGTTRYVTTLPMTRTMTVYATSAANRRSPPGSVAPRLSATS